MKLKFKYNLLYIVLLFSSVTTGYAQRGGYSMNFLNLVPQQNKFNPAYFTYYRNYIGLPMQSSFQVNNEAFTISRLFEGSSGMIVGLAAENNFGAEAAIDIFSLGFKVGDNNQFHLGLGVEGYFNAFLTKRTARLLLEGPGRFIGRDGADVLAGNSVDMSVHGFLSVGYSREINERISVGTRVRFLSGLMNIHTDRSDIDLFIDEGLDPDVVPYTYFLKPDIAINYSFEMPQSLLNNFGVGFDFGAVFEATEQVTVAASINDIGFINWRGDSVRRITSQRQERPFVFSGLGNLNDIINNDGFDIREIASALIDSITDFLQLNEIDTTFTSYRSPLRTSYNLSFFYNITDNDQIGIMWNSQFGKRKYNALTIAYTRTFGRNFQFCINNAIINDNPFNFGGGLAFNLRAFQFYLAVDKISSFRVVNMRAVNFQFGLNFVFNRTEKDPNKRRVIRDYTPRDRTGYVNDRWAW